MEILRLRMFLFPGDSPVIDLSIMTHVLINGQQAFLIQVWKPTRYEPAISRSEICNSRLSRWSDASELLQSLGQNAVDGVCTTWWMEEQLNLPTSTIVPVYPFSSTQKMLLIVTYRKQRCFETDFSDLFRCFQTTVDHKWVNSNWFDWDATIYPIGSMVVKYLPIHLSTI